MAKATDIKKHKINQLQIYRNSKFLSSYQTFDADEVPPVTMSHVLKAKIL